MLSAKQKNNHKYSFFTKRIKYIALVLLISVFASTCLLPISEAKAAKKLPIPAGYIETASGLVVKSSTLGTATKTSGKGALLGTAFGAAKYALIATGIVAFVVVLLGITTSFVNAAITMDATYYNLNNAFVNRGWVMVRDICNLFFLLVLLFIAFCTILQIEKYNAKKNLLTLILMALLINFSKPIAIFIFDGSQLMMQWFLRDGADITSALGLASHVGNLLSDFTKGGQDLVAGVLVGIVFTFVYIVVLFCLGLFLFIRLVAIWLLVIVSPVAFFAMILPDFRKLSTQWWDALFRYSYVGPAIAFFLWLSSSLVAQIGRMKNMNSAVGGDIGSAFLNTQFFIPYIITIIFLFAALMMANQFGIYFSQTITKGANRFMSWAAISALKWGERATLMKPITIGGKQFSLSPRAWIKGWQEHSAEVDRRALEQAMAHPRDVLSSIFKRGERPKTYFRDLQFSKLEAEKMKEIESVSTESSYMFDIIEKAKKTKSREAQAAASAALKILAKNNDQDDYMIDYHREAHNPLKAKQKMKEDLMATGLTEREIGKIFYQLGGIALPSGNMGYWGMSTYDRDTGEYKVLDDKSQLGKIRAKAQTFETQQLAKILHRNALMEEAADQYYTDPNTGKIKYNKRVFPRVHEVGQVMAEILGENLAALEQFKGRGKVDTLLASGGPSSVPAWENMARESLNSYKNLSRALGKLEQALVRAQASGRTDQVQRISAKMEEINNLYRNAQIYLNFGATAHQAYTKGKDSKAIQLNAKEFKDFKEKGKNLKDIVKEVLVRLQREEAKKRRGGQEPEITEGGGSDTGD